MPLQSPRASRSRALSIDHLADRYAMVGIHQSARPSGDAKGFSLRGCGFSVAGSNSIARILDQLKLILADVATKGRQHHQWCRYGMEADTKDCSWMSTP